MGNKFLGNHSSGFCIAGQIISIIRCRCLKIIAEEHSQKSHHFFVLKMKEREIKEKNEGKKNKNKCQLSVLVLVQGVFC
jgi:hypothetical protein